MQTNTVIGTTTLMSAIGISFITPISAEACIGAFAGSMVYALSPTGLPRWKQNFFSFLAFILGVTGQSSLSRFAWVNEAVAAAIISSISIYALLALVTFAKTDRFKNMVSGVARNFTGVNGGGDKNE